MSEGVGIWRCKACGAAYFPERLLCSRCHGHDFATERVTEGVVEESPSSATYWGKPIGSRTVLPMCAR